MYNCIDYQKIIFINQWIKVFNHLKELENIENIVTVHRILEF